MTSNIMPGSDLSGFDDDDWIDCYDCGGEGVLDESCECETVVDLCCCAEPTPRRCPTCKGEGGWVIDHSAEDQAAYENEKTDMGGDT